MSLPELTIDSEETIARHIVLDLVAGDLGPMAVTLIGLDLVVYDSIVMNVRHEDLGGFSRSVTPDATQGYVEDTTTVYPCADQDGLTVTVPIDEGLVQIVTFNGVTTTLASILSQMTAQLTGATVIDNGSGQPRIVSDSGGEDSSVGAPGGTSIFTWGTPVDGTGDAELGSVDWQPGDLVEGRATAEIEFTTGADVFTLPRRFPVDLSVRRAIG